MMCGYMSVFFLIHRSRGKTFNQIVNMFKKNKYRYNENLVKSFFKNVSFPKQRECLSYCSKVCKMKEMDFQSVCIQKNNICTKL